jgi:probable HAF family extracellular repeat protein
MPTRRRHVIAGSNPEKDFTDDFGATFDTQGEAMQQHTGSSIRTITLAIAVAALTVTTAWGQQTAAQPSARGAVHSRLGLPIARPEAPPTDLTNRQPQPTSLTALNFTFGMVDFPGSVATLANGVNKSGHIVGGFGPDILLDYAPDHGFVLKGTKFTQIDYPGAGWTSPNAINDAGVIVGVWGASFYDEHGFKLAGTTYTSIDYPGAAYTYASGINKSGQIVGYWWPNGHDSHGFLLSKGVFTTFDYPGATQTFPFGINAAGEIVGSYANSDGSTHGFLLYKGTFTAVDYPGYSQNYLADINDSGVIIGGYGEPTTINGVPYAWEHCFVYQNGQFTTFDAPFGPPAVTQDYHISSTGTIAGFYVDNSGTTYGFEVTVGP